MQPLAPSDLHGTARAALARWELPAATSLSLFNLSENAIFQLTTPSGDKFALRIHRPGYQGDAAIRSELAWVMALRRDTDILTPMPVAGLDGAYLQQVMDRRCVLFRWESGAEPVIGTALESHFETLGKLAAIMNRHARSWPRPADFTRQSWTVETALGDEAPLWGRWRDGLGMTPQLLDLFAKTVALLRARLSRFGMGPDRFGLIHGDLRLANLLIDGEAVKLLDFDDCGFGWYLYDAATPVSFHEDHPDVPRLIRHWVAGYRAQGALSQAEEEEIASFVILRRLLLVAWVGSHQDADYPRSLGPAFTTATAPLCRAYLDSHG